MRDRVIDPARAFYNSYTLDEKEQREVMRRLRLEDFEPSYTPLTPFEMRQEAGDPRLDEFFRFDTPIVFFQDYLAILEKLAPGTPFEDLMPPILYFADSNWAYYDFGFAYNPGTDALELWRIHHNRKEGVPMTIWKHYLDGREKKEWGVLMRPFEYGGKYSRKLDEPRFKI